jgi:hypothetical protein
VQQLLENASFVRRDFPAAIMTTLVSSLLHLTQVALIVVLHCIKAHIDMRKKEVTPKQ